MARGADHYWLDPCTSFGWNNATQNGFGCDRSVGSGTGYAGIYSPQLRALLERPETTPLELLLFFHNVPWETPLTRSGDSWTWRLATTRQANSALLIQALL